MPRKSSAKKVAPKYITGKQRAEMTEEELAQHREYWRQHREDYAARKPKKVAFDRKKYNATKSGQVFTLEWEEFKHKMVDTCPYCSGEVRWSQQQKRDDFDMEKSATFDKIDPKLGYVHDNVVTACQRCNRQKGDLDTEEWGAVMAVRRKRGQVK